MARVLIVLSTLALTVGEKACPRQGECYHFQLQRCEGADKLTIHGLWPQWDENCEGPEFDSGDISSIRTDMESNWLSCPEHKMSNEEFWSHEWKRHGTCSKMPVLQYFQRTLELYAQHTDACSADACALCFSEDLDEMEDCRRGS
eukprot:CAMPEP_0179299484 /NCGR_PEP_ID=MMETSP0797-20121207/46541_1 /TAXON_ID=47934 /ORGANISM="Dinophysis acuminata, Strain DAEP01" /LENGTH=144 /DNA_ID=CAMNT_0021008921 /DNA_START=60 /DNA_END=490 /DNA_ORIENTATION=+